MPEMAGYPGPVDGLAYDDQGDAGQGQDCHGQATSFFYRMSFLSILIFGGHSSAAPMSTAP